MAPLLTKTLLSVSTILIQLSKTSIKNLLYSANKNNLNALSPSALKFTTSTVWMHCSVTVQAPKTCWLFKFPLRNFTVSISGTELDFFILFVNSSSIVLLYCGTIPALLVNYHDFIYRPHGRTDRIPMYDHKAVVKLVMLKQAFLLVSRFLSQEHFIKQKNHYCYLRIFFPTFCLFASFFHNFDFI